MTSRAPYWRATVKPIYIQLMKHKLEPLNIYFVYDIPISTWSKGGTTTRLCQENPSIRHEGLVEEKQTDTRQKNKMSEATVRMTEKERNLSGKTNEELICARTLNMRVFTRSTLWCNYRNKVLRIFIAVVALSFVRWLLLESRPRCKIFSKVCELARSLSAKETPNLSAISLQKNKGSRRKPWMKLQTRPNQSVQRIPNQPNSDMVDLLFRVRIVSHNSQQT